MQNLLFESPLFLLFVGGCVIGLVAFWWVQSRTKIAFFALLGTVALTVALFLTSLQVVTAREKLNAILHEIVEAIEKNDHANVFRHIHPRAADSVLSAKQQLPSYTFTQARVSRIKDIVINHDTTPPTAIAEFNVTATVNLQSHPIKIARFVRLFFMQDGDQWLVRDFEHFEPTAGFRNELPAPQR